ncbi:MAG: prephenate dehydrogenase/arogenate dehydrogenase family protein [Pseudomonadota bacterium]
MEKIFKHIAIAGLGLIGGSLARDIKDKGLADKITGYGRNAERMKKARALGIVDECFVGFDTGLDDADLVIIGTPVGMIEPTAKEMAPHLRPGTIVTDVGSVKAAIVEALEPQMPHGVCFIGGHPISGAENSGFEAALSGLFANRVCVLTPTDGSNQQALARLKLFWERIGSRVVLMDKNTHDRIFAGISHLPHMVAFSLVNALVDMEDFEKQILEYSAGGFKDFTRIAASDPVMWRDIALMNRDNILSALGFFETSLAALKGALIEEDEKKIEELFRKSRDTRQRICMSKRGA